jgi:hypothetical protein
MDVDPACKCDNPRQLALFGNKPMQTIRLGRVWAM